MKQLKSIMRDSLIIKLLGQTILICMLALVSIQVTAVERVTYYHNDALGSPVAATDNNGNLLWRESYGPYGERIKREDSGTNERWFTGKQEESEFGISYFGARWYDSGTGRFMGIDPVGFSGVHSFNRYTYANNNPYKYVDPDGRWPTETHTNIINQAFPGLSQNQRTLLSSVSKMVDRGQTKNSNHAHAMKSPGENSATARLAISEKIQNIEQLAKRRQRNTPTKVDQITNGALTSFGRGLHAVTDRTSPAHTDASGNPRDWAGIPTSYSQVKAVQQHGAEEANITSGQLSSAISAARQSFGRTFGATALNAVIKQPKR